MTTVVNQNTLNRINQLQQEINALNSENNTYNTLLNQVNNAKNHLENANRKMNTSQTDLVRFYSVDGRINDDGRFRNVINEIIQLINSTDSFRNAIINQQNNNRNSINAKNDEKRRLEESLLIR